jgi:hypothetical protein
MRTGSACALPVAHTRALNKVSATNRVNGARKVRWVPRVLKVLKVLRLFMVMSFEGDASMASAAVTSTINGLGGASDDKLR